MLAEQALVLYVANQGLFDCSEKKPTVSITENGANTFEEEADYHPAICNVINEMPGAIWDRVSRTHRIQSEHLTVFVETLTVVPQG